MRETHIGVVFLLGDHAYKMKKPVTTAFLDFSTPQRRLAACRREVELNRRLAPDVYLGVSGVSGAELPPWTGRGADGAPVEHLVVMRRMPDDRRLSTLVRAGAPVQDHLRDLARSVAAFHAAARRGPESPRRAAATRSAAGGRRTSSRYGRQCTVPAPETVDAVDRLAARFLAGRGPLFADRCADGRIVDGHGDLIADDVFCLDDGPRALDCLEFDDKLRYVDGLDDVAFLAMDLERLGRPDLADDWLDDYVEFSGDPAPVALRHHYVAYRAFVRAKVACLRHQQGDADRSDGRGAVRRPQPAAPRGRSRAARAGRGPARHRQDHRRRGAGRPVRRRAALQRPATQGTRRPLPHPARPRGLRRGPLHRQRHRRAVRAAAAPGRGTAGPRRVGGARRVVDPRAAPGGRRRTGRGAPTATWSAWSAAPPPTSPPHASRAAAPPPRTRRPPSARAMSAAADPWPDAVTVCTSGELADSLHRAAQAWQAAPTAGHSRFLPCHALPGARS